MNRIDLFDGYYLCYSKGNFDYWCVYEVAPTGARKAPRDVDYFRELDELKNIFGAEKLYQDFILIYDWTKKELEQEVVDKIREVSFHYPSFYPKVFRIFATIYMGMIAEENRKNTRLGKRIKRLGVYQLLIQSKSPEYSANFMTKMGWREIDALCKEAGF